MTYSRTTSSKSCIITECNMATIITFVHPYQTVVSIKIASMHVLHPVLQDEDLESDPLTWRSEEEAFFRMGVWTGKGPVEYSPSKIGGSQVFREVPNYSMDTKRGPLQWDQCTKHKTESSSHLPGIMAHWCLQCGICKLVSLMKTAECSRTVADLLIAFYDLPPNIFSYDNG